MRVAYDRQEAFHVRVVVVDMGRNSQSSEARSNVDLVEVFIAAALAARYSVGAVGVCYMRS